MDLGPGSTTERLLNDDLDYMARDYMFSGVYIWHTVGDDKVRGSHAARNGQRFFWSDPPEGGHPSEDYNCRCWAEYVNPPYHSWREWVDEQRDKRLAQSSIVEKLAEPEGLKVKVTDLKTSVPVDAINPTVSLLDFIGLGKPAVKIAAEEVIIPAARAGASATARLGAELAAKLRDVEWIQNTSMSQFQKKFRHAGVFGVKGNPNKQSLEAYKKAIEQHVKSPDTVVKNGTYHKEPVMHYYNEKTGINVMRDSNGQFKSAWKLTKIQKEYIKKGKLGGNKK